MEYNVAKYPEGYEKIKKEELPFLPDDEDTREFFMNDLLQWLIQW
jgi:hypothetical protein